MVEKIGIVEILRISKHGSGHYLRIPKEILEWHDLKRGDRLKVKIEEVIRRGGTKEATGHEKGLGASAGSLRVR